MLVSVLMSDTTNIGIDFASGKDESAVVLIKQPKGGNDDLNYPGGQISTECLRRIESSKFHKACNRPSSSLLSPDTKS